MFKNKNVDKNKLKKDLFNLNLKNNLFLIIFLL